MDATIRARDRTSGIVDQNDSERDSKVEGLMGKGILWIAVSCVVLVCLRVWAQEISPIERADTNWFNFVVMATAIVGAVTGIAGSIMGYIGYQRSNEFKKSDRRIELARLISDARLASNGLLELLQEALRSRKAALNARGLFRSSLMTRYESQHAQDTSRARELSRQVTAADEVNRDSMSLSQLEEELGCVYEIKGAIDLLSGKYRSSLEEDETNRGRG